MYPPGLADVRTVTSLRASSRPSAIAKELEWY